MEYTCSKKINTYLANLGVWTVKLHNLHWNVVGKMFVGVHQFTEALYNEAFENYDSVAELLKMRDQFPLASMREYLDVATIKEEPSRLFSCCEVAQIVEDDLNLMRELAVEIRADAAEKDDFRVVTMFEDFIKYYDKQIWFLRAMKKEMTPAEGQAVESCGCHK